MAGWREGRKRTVELCGLIDELGETKAATHGPLSDGCTGAEVCGEGRREGAVEGTDTKGSAKGSEQLVEGRHVGAPSDRRPPAPGVVVPETKVGMIVELRGPPVRRDEQAQPVVNVGLELGPLLARPGFLRVDQEQGDVRGSIDAGPGRAQNLQKVALRSEVEPERAEVTLG